MSFTGFWFVHRVVSMRKMVDFRLRSEGELEGTMTDSAPNADVIDILTSDARTPSNTTSRSTRNSNGP